MKRILLAASVALALGACTTMTGPTPAGVQVTAAKAEYDFEAAYNAAASAYLAVDTSLPAGTKAQAKAGLQKAYQAVLAARQAQKLGDSSTLAQKIADVQTLVANVHALIGQ